MIIPWRLPRKDSKSSWYFFAVIVTDCGNTLCLEEFLTQKECRRQRKFQKAVTICRCLLALNIEREEWKPIIFSEKFSEAVRKFPCFLDITYSDLSYPETTFSLLSISQPLPSLLALSQHIENAYNCKKPSTSMNSHIEVTTIMTASEYINYSTSCCQEEIQSRL